MVWGTAGLPTTIPRKILKQVCLEVISVYLKKVFASFDQDKSCLRNMIAFCNEMMSSAVSQYLREDYQGHGGAQ